VFLIYVILSVDGIPLLREKSVTSRTFEGLDLFGDEIDYVLKYLGFLISINDENSEFFFTAHSLPIPNKSFI
jgi:Suppressor of forked protein (Suf)